MDVTLDTMFRGRLVVRQEKGGYRFSVDAVLLAGLAGVQPEDRVVDLGTGCGIIPLILAYRKKGRSIVGLEIQSDLAELAEWNVSTNRFSDRIELRNLDFRKVSEYFQPQSFDVVLSNPPYRRLESGRINLHPQKAMARHELAASIREVFAAGKFLLRWGGRLTVIYPATRLGHLLVTAQQHGFSPKELTVIYSDASGGPARLVCVECRKGGGEELQVKPPFFIYAGEGEYSAAMQALYVEV